MHSWSITNGNVVGKIAEGQIADRSSAAANATHVEGKRAETGLREHVLDLGKIRSSAQSGCQQDDVRPVTP